MQVSSILQDQPQGSETLEDCDGPNFTTVRLQEGGRWRSSSAQIKYLHFLPAASADPVTGSTAQAMGNNGQGGGADLAMRSSTSSDGMPLLLVGTQHHLQAYSPAVSKGSIEKKVSGYPQL